MDLLAHDYERIAMCAHPEGTHEHVNLKQGEEPPETCFADCECKPVVFVRADLHAGAVAALEQIAAGHSCADHRQGVAQLRGIAERWLTTNRGQSGA